MIAIARISYYFLLSTRDQSGLMERGLGVMSFLSWMNVEWLEVNCPPRLPTFLCTNVTGIWKTDQIVTLILFHFIDPANSYTCTLHIHSSITRLG